MRKIQNKPEALRELYKFLKLNVEMSRWWPAESRFEIFVGVVLTQNTAWSNVEKSLANLRKAGLLEAKNLLDSSDEILQEHIRPSGFMRAKSGYLKELGRAFFYYDENFRKLDYCDLRRRLLEIKGIGEESADTLCLYAYDKSCFIYDKYGLRLLEICNFIETGLKYRQAKRLFDEIYYGADFSFEEAKALHGLIVDANKFSQRGFLDRERINKGISELVNRGNFGDLLFNLNECRVARNGEVSEAKRLLAEFLLKFI